MTPQDNLDVVLRVLDELGVDDYTRFCTVLTGWAESDFDGSAVQVMQDGVNVTTGVFQQSSRWWPDSALAGTEAQCRAFLDNFRRVTGTYELDCWLVQHWAPPEADRTTGLPVDIDAWWASRETVNYTRRLPDIPAIISERKLP